MAESRQMDDRKGWPTGDANRTRRRLLEAAREVFNTEGYFETDTNKLARAAGYAPATFYKHFKDKREIFLEVYREWVVSEWTQLREGPRDLREALAQTLDHHTRWVGIRRSLRALVLTDPVVREARLHERERQMGLLRELLVSQDRASLDRTTLMFVLYVVEKMCDAIADGETVALHVTSSGLFDELVHAVEACIDAEHHRKDLS